MLSRMCLALAVVGFVSVCRGAEPSVEDLAQRVASLEAELAQQDAELSSLKSAVGRGAVGGQGECDAWSTYGAYELAILQPFFSDLDSGPGFDDSFGAGHRFTLGVESHRGCGVRVRYWMYDHALAGYGFFAGEELHIDMDALDLDVTLRERFRRWDLLMSGGLRYGRNGYSSDTIFGPGETLFEGLGPTFSLEADRKISCHGLHLIGNFRGSMLFGDVGAVGFTVEDELMTVFENQLGVGWKRPLGRAMLDVRAVWESQFWLNNAFAFGLGSNLGLTGPTVAVELRR
jgi:hypothetical protein